MEIYKTYAIQYPQSQTHSTGHKLVRTICLDINTISEQYMAKIPRQKSCTVQDSKMSLGNMITPLFV